MALKFYILMHAVEQTNNCALMIALPFQLSFANLLFILLSYLAMPMLGGCTLKQHLDLNRKSQPNWGWASIYA